MTTWQQLTDAVPDLAPRIAARFAATGLGLIATLRKDGSPRVSGVEPLIADGELWLGMMDGSRKAADLLRDPRFALHAATTDKDVKEGDAKVAGSAIEVTDETTFARFRALLSQETGNEPPPPFHLFQADLTDASLLQLGHDGTYLLIESWTASGGYCRTERR
jgi:hypothetical protein